jgi:hypothetical protein
MSASGRAARRVIAAIRPAVGINNCRRRDTGNGASRPFTDDAGRPARSKK